MPHADPERRKAWKRQRWANATPEMRQANREAGRRFHAAHPEASEQYRRARGVKPLAQHRSDQAYMKAWKRKAFGERRDRVNAIKLEHGCADCGRADHPAALDLDHLDPLTKVAPVSAMVMDGRYTWADIEAEVAKCEVVCASCHRVRTATRGEFGPRRNANHGTTPPDDPPLTLFG